MIGALESNLVAIIFAKCASKFLAGAWFHYYVALGILDVQGITLTTVHFRSGIHRSKRNVIDAIIIFVNFLYIFVCSDMIV